jgi:hypothetical protein
LNYTAESAVCPKQSLVRKNGQKICKLHLKNFPRNRLRIVSKYKENAKIQSGGLEIKDYENLVTLSRNVI